MYVSVTNTIYNSNAKDIKCITPQFGQTIFYYLKLTLTIKVHCIT